VLDRRAWTPLGYCIPPAESPRQAGVVCPRHAGLPEHLGYSKENISTAKKRFVIFKTISEIKYTKDKFI
jgi:hypothetical protein